LPDPQGPSPCFRVSAARFGLLWHTLAHEFADLRVRRLELLCRSRADCLAQAGSQRSSAEVLHFDVTVCVPCATLARGQAREHRRRRSCSFPPHIPHKPTSPLRLHGAFGEAVKAWPSADNQGGQRERRDQGEQRTSTRQTDVVSDLDQLVTTQSSQEFLIVTDLEGGAVPLLPARRLLAMAHAHGNAGSAVVAGRESCASHESETWTVLS
jgi:hypothetical protein